MSAKSRIILGIDPGYDRLGWAIGTKQGQNLSVNDFGCIQTNKKQDLVERFSHILIDLKKIIDVYKPTELGIETLYFSRNVSTAMQVSEVRGLILGLAIENNMVINQFNPNQIKLAVTGHGRADKKAVDKMTRLQLKIKQEKIIDDAMDALAIMLTASLV